MLLPLLSAFQLAATQPAVHNGRAGETSVAPPKIEASVTIDGRLDEAPWARAAILNGFSLYAPADGNPAALAHGVPAAKAPQPATGAENKPAQPDAKKPADALPF